MSGAVVKAMRECPLPIVAAVNGVAAGAGSVLALASDFRLLARSAKFSFLFTRVGPGRRGHGRRVPPPAARGPRPRDRAARARRQGRRRARARDRARHEVVDDDELPAAANALARRLAEGPALAYSTTKMLLTRELDLDLGGAIELEALAQALLMKSDDFGEFYAAWSEAQAAWTGR